MSKKYRRLHYGWPPDYPLSDPEYDNENPAFLQERLKGQDVSVRTIVWSFVE